MKDMIKSVLRGFNKRGISSDVLVIILLVVALAIMVVLFLAFGIRSSKSQDTLFNITNSLNINRSA